MFKSQHVIFGFSKAVLGCPRHKFKRVIKSFRGYLSMK